MYICVKCKREWSEELAEQNEYLCTRKCEGELVPKQAVAPDFRDLIERLPFPIAYPWFMSLNTTLHPVQRVNNMIFTAYQAMRLTGLLLLSDYLESDGNCVTLGRPLGCMRMPHWWDWKYLTDSLAKYLTGKNARYAPPTNALCSQLAKDWMTMASLWRKDAVSVGFKKENGIPSPIEIFQALRNDRAHRMGVQDEKGDELEILERFHPVLRFALEGLFAARDLCLLRLPLVDPSSRKSMPALLSDPSAEKTSLILLHGVHQDFQFGLDEWELTESLREVLTKSPIAVRYEGSFFPVYPFFLALDMETQETGGLIEPMSMVDAFTGKKVVHLGVKSHGTIETLGAKVVALLARKNHELGLSREEANRWLMVEWARDNALATLRHMTMSKYFPQCYVERPADRRLFSAMGRPGKAVLITGEAGTGKSSLLCRFVETLIEGSVQAEQLGVRKKHFDKKVKDRSMADSDAMDAFLSLKGSGDVVVFLSGRGGIPVETGETMERAFCRTLLRACGVKESEFGTPMEFMKRLDENVTGHEQSAKKDADQDRKVWIVLDAINEVDRFRDFAVCLDHFIRESCRYPWLRLICSSRTGAIEVLSESARLQNIHGPAPFADEKIYHTFSNFYSTGPREEPKLEVPSFTAQEGRTAYEMRQERLSERAALNQYDALGRPVQDLLRAPLYLHVFHETWKGRRANLRAGLGENALFEAYLESLSRELPGIEHTIEAIADYFYEYETPIWPEEEVWALTEQWIRRNHVDSVFRVCALTPVETLVSASLLMRPTDDDRAYQFSHQKICEEVLRRKLQSLWEKTDRSKESVIGLFKSWVEKCERFDWLSNAAASFLVGWVGGDRARFLPLILKTGAHADRALRTICQAILLAMCEESALLDDEAIEFLKGGFAPDSAYEPFFLALDDMNRIATQTGRTRGALAVQKACLPFQERLVAMQSDRIDFRRDMCVICDNLGHIYKALGSGKKALEFYEKSLRIREDLVVLEPDRTDFRSDLTGSFSELGYTYRHMGEKKKALEFYEKSLRIREDLVALEPDRTDFRSNLSVSFNNVGNIYETIGEGKKALEFYEKSLRIREDLVALEPDRTDFRHELSVAFHCMGSIYETMGEKKRGLGLEFLEKSLRIREDLVALEPDRTDFRCFLNVGFMYVGNIYETMGEKKKALEFYEKSLQVSEDLVALEPDRTDFRHELSVAFHCMGSIYETMGEKKRGLGLEFLEKSLRIREDLVALEPDRTDFRLGLSVSFNNVGNIYEAIGEGKKALEFYEKSLQIREELVTLEPDRTDFRCRLSVSFSNVGNIYEAIGEGKKALEFYEKSLQVSEDLVVLEPDRADFRSDLSVSFNNVGNIYETIGEGKKALEFYEKSVRISEDLVALEPDRTDFRSDLSVSFNNVGHTYGTMGEGKKALEFYEKSLRIREDLVALEPDRTDFRSDLSESFNNLGYTYGTMGEGKKALEFYEKSVRISEDLVALEPDRTHFRNVLGKTFNNMGDIYRTMGERKKALEFFKKSLRIDEGLVALAPNNTDFRLGVATVCWNISLIFPGEEKVEWLKKAQEILEPVVTGDILLQSRVQRLLGLLKRELGKRGYNSPHKHDKRLMFRTSWRSFISKIVKRIL